MNERDRIRGNRIRTGLSVGVCALVLGGAGVLIYSLGAGAFRVFGLVLIVFGVMGLGQAAAIALGHLTPDAPRDRRGRDAGGD